MLPSRSVVAGYVFMPDGGGMKLELCGVGAELPPKSSISRPFPRPESAAGLVSGSPEPMPSKSSIRLISAGAAADCLAAFLSVTFSSSLDVSSSSLPFFSFLPFLVSILGADFA